MLKAVAMKPSRWVCLAYYMLPIGLTTLSLKLLSAYMQYYDIGVNAAANSGFLMLFVAPALLLGLYVAAFILWRLVRHLVTPPWLAIALCSGLLLLITVIVLLVMVQSYASYPTENAQDLTVFLNDYVKKLLNHTP